MACKIRIWGILCFVLLGIICMKAQDQSQKKPLDVFKNLENINKYTKQIQDKNKNDIFIKNKTSQIITNVKELQNLFSTSQQSKVSKIYIESLLVYEDFLENYINNKINSPEDKLKSKLIELNEELSIKLNFAKSSRGALSLIQIVVETIRNQREEGGYEIWYVPRGWAGESDHYQRFDNISSPSVADLPPGNYLIWANKASSKTEPLLIALGTDKDSKRVIQISIP